MFIDSLNCYYIHYDEKDKLPYNGLYVYFPELNSVYFYEEKDKSKTYNFQLDEISIITDKKDRILKIQIIDSSIKRKHVFFYSQTNNNHFIQYFRDERLNKIDLMQKTNQIDYLLLVKRSNKLFVGESNEEVRIVRIDWANLEIKYYGDEKMEVIPNTETKIPKYYPEIKLVNSIPLPVLKTKLATKGVNASDIEKYKKQLLDNGYGMAFEYQRAIQQVSTDPEYKDIDELIEQFIKSNLLSSLTHSSVTENLLSKRDTFRSLMHYFSSSNFTNNWYEKMSRSKFISRYIEFLSYNSVLQASNNILHLPLDPIQTGMTTFAVIHINYIRALKAQHQELVIPIPFNGQVINFPINAELYQNNPNATRITSCGAENCYFPFDIPESAGAGAGSKRYGLRISSLVYRETEL